MDISCNVHGVMRNIHFSWKARRDRSMWEVSIEIGIQELGHDWTQLVQDRVQCPALTCVTLKLRAP